MTMDEFYKKVHHMKASDDVLCPKCGAVLKDISTAYGDYLCMECDGVFEVDEEGDLVDHTEEAYEVLYSDGEDHEFDDEEN